MSFYIFVISDKLRWEVLRIMLDPHISKVRDFVIAVEKLTARNDVFFLFKSPTENALSLSFSLYLDAPVFELPRREQREL